MNKKTITLRIDPITKLILLILGAGVWVMALKPITNSTAYAELSGFDLSGIESKIGWVELKLGRIDSTLGDINVSIGNIPSR